ncbi:MaoC/PaaZ C-terminal domain-containing protein [Candidatus Entotheonella palauensis]|uniref:MaoC/PaaZ C-terminal domain-containing protein n=1 Tax=Candidatus Entotheonella palauensis TaxID=93172 RepID=UPI000B7DAC6C|nr:MaoC/PaaZ C-terminal domain-containing protein [Candidatus Entotheonella palauensis]
MPIRSAALGNQTPPQVVDITPRRLLSYAAGLGESHPHYLDDAATTGIVGHPAFCVALEWPVTLMLRDEESLGMSWEERIWGVHAAQDSIFHRPIYPGDRLRTVASLVQIRRIRPGALVLTKFETVDDRTDAPVATSYASSIYRGVEVEGEDMCIEEAPGLPVAAQSAADLTQVPIPIAREAPHVYTECARIWNPIHTERQVALQAGLPDIILHGTATWALAASHLIQRCAQADPTRLRRFTGRFTAMVIPGSTITLEYREPQGDTVSYSVCNAEGEPAISQGIAVLGEPQG